MATVLLLLTNVPPGQSPLAEQGTVLNSVVPFALGTALPSCHPAPALF